jgi:hypothetical protein
MQVKHGSEFLKFAALAAGFIASSSLATAQQAPPAPQQAAHAPSIPLQTYTAPDSSATVGVPAGWKVTKAAYGVIQMSGPNGEAISLGNVLFVRNGTYQPGQHSSGLIAMTLPYQATITQKAEAVWQMGAAASGDPSAGVKLISATPIPLGSIAQCGIFLGSLTSAKGASNFESRFCSMPMDTNGIYKLFWLNASLPTSVAAQERATAEAVLSSYRPSQATLMALLKPETPPVPPMGYAAPGGGPGMSSTDYGEIQAQHTSDCMDEGVLREEPAWQLPPYCR